MPGLTLNHPLVSSVPSYNSARPPPYTVDDTPASSAGTSTTQRPQQRGLPPITAARDPVPSLTAFAIPSWPSLTPNPTTRHYRSVAQRRVAAASDRIGSPLHRNILGRTGEEDSDDRPRSSGARPASRGTAASPPRDAPPTLLGWGPTTGRPLEDSSLVGEDAARRARDERLRRERDEILVLENRRWDWYLSEFPACCVPT
ncbi:hypothetical protein IMZ48_45770 [Candidatus Bathyarchaeota archaeon]|nr:hypothetical protein [Candidatus Bathyarchaeota archaeon]